MPPTSKEVIDDKMNPTLYKFYVSIAIVFLFLALVVFPLEEPGSPEFYADLYGIILLILFIILITIYYMKTKPPITEETYPLITISYLLPWSAQQ